MAVATLTFTSWSADMSGKPILYDQDEATPEEALALAVITLALGDLGLVPGLTASNNPADRAEAEQFLADQHGPWAQARRAWLDVAGIDCGAFDHHLAILRAAHRNLRRLSDAA